MFSRGGSRSLLLLIPLALGACTATTPVPDQPPGSTAGPSRDANKLLVVDCLLPGQIRQLGQFATYLSPRRPVKTTAGDCGLRGGEYVAYDRANYTTALAVWLPQAEAGDPAAQTYVGEIYEKGLGTAPDYALAARWYGKAADQGYARAQMNLGFLHEQGLGVNKDSVAALNWYRKASGLTSDQLAFASSIEQLRTERQAADREVSLRRQEADRLRQQVRQTQQELEAQSRKLQAAQRELEKTRQELERQRSAPGAATVRGGDIAALERRVLEQQALLEQQNQKLGFLQQEAQIQQSQLTVELRASQQREEVLQRDIAAQARERELLQQQVSTLQAQQAKYQGDLDARNRELEAQRLALQQAQEALERERRTGADQNSAEIQRLEQQLSTRNAELAKTQGQIEALKTAMEVDQQRLVQLQSSPPQQVVRGSTEGPVASSAASSAAPAPKLDFGRYYALIIGNNRYAAFPNLETAVNDAEAVAKVLRARYGFTTRVLTNADRYSVLSALNEMREKLTEKDNFLLYYAGHGELDRANARGHWLPVDAEPNSTANWISNVEITDILNTMSAKHVMVITDSCYSGTLTRSVTTTIGGAHSDEKRIAWLQLMINTRSRTVLTSGGLAPVLDGGGGSHSIFAKVLLEVLEKNSDILEGPALYQQVARHVKAAATRLKVEQDPQYAPMRFAGDLGAPFFFAPAS